MNKRILCLSLAFLLGCSALPHSGKAGIPQGRKKSAAGTSASHNSKAGKIPAPAEEIPTGTIFAKTIFEGVVKTSYVELTIVDQSDTSKVYQLYIGDKARQKNFPWKIQTVSPGYFFVELPPGKYQIKAIAIPVGTALATEPMDITFEVTAKKNAYLGTLKVIGTKERIRFGGVPIIKPGFEYRCEFSDDRQEAFRELRERFREVKGEIMVKFLKINQENNFETAMPKLP